MLKLLLPLLVLFALLLPVQGDAACAWILWNDLVSDPGTKMRHLEAFETFADCNREAGKRAQLESIKTKEGSWKILYSCWPDTFDPRR